jgi:hypothetical protein
MPKTPADAMLGELLSAESVFDADWGSLKRRAEILLEAII